MDKERRFEASQSAIRDSEASRQASGVDNGQPPVTDEEFVATESTAHDLGSTVGSVSGAESLLGGINGETETQRPIEPAEEDVVEAEGGHVFTAPTRALLDLTLREKNGEQAETQERESIRESIIEEIKGAIEGWSKYEAIEDLRLPKDIDQLSRFNRDFDGLIERLTDIKAAMLEFGRTQEGMMPDGTNIGETLHPVLMPWEFFAHRVRNGTLPSGLKLLRERQGIEEHVLDYPFMIRRDSLMEGKDATYDGKSSSGYLWGKVNNEGWWGIFLVQSQQPYASSPGEELMPPIEIEEIRNYRQSFERNELNVSPRRINGFNIDGLGVYEWLALTLQQEPENFKGNLTLLSANMRLRESHRENVLIAYGGWDEKRKRVIQNWVLTDDVNKEGYVNRISIDPLLEREPEGELES